jgi:hypothetical protein
MPLAGYASRDGGILQGDFDKMQGGPAQFIAESHCAVVSWKNLSLSKEQGEASGIAGKTQGRPGLQRGRIRDHGTRPDHNLFARSGLHSVENRYHRIRQRGPIQ